MGVLGDDGVITSRGLGKCVRLVWGSVLLLQVSWVYKWSPAASHHAGWGPSSGCNAMASLGLTPRHCLCPVCTEEVLVAQERCWSLALRGAHRRCAPRTLPSHWSLLGLGVLSVKALLYASIGYR